MLSQPWRERWSLCLFLTNNPLFALQASKAGLCIHRPGLKMEEEESQGWFNWMWNWGQEAEAKPKEVKSAGGTGVAHCLRSASNIRLTCCQ